jgi:hypothetical protein
VKYFLKSLPFEAGSGFGKVVVESAAGVEEAIVEVVTSEVVVVVVDVVEDFCLQIQIGHLK